jgi:hypothetical protein
MVEWKKLLELVWLLLTPVACVAVFFGLYNSIGVTNALVITLVVAFLMLLFGYILFEKVMD